MKRGVGFCSLCDEAYPSLVVWNNGTKVWFLKSCFRWPQTTPTLAVCSANDQESIKLCDLHPLFFDLTHCRYPWLSPFPAGTLYWQVQLLFRPSITTQKVAHQSRFGAFRWGLFGDVALSDKTGFHQGWNEDFGDAIVDFLLTLWRAHNEYGGKTWRGMYFGKTAAPICYTVGTQDIEQRMGCDLFDRFCPRSLWLFGKQFNSNLFECSQIPLAERHWRYFLCVEFYLVTVGSRYRRTE